MRIVVEGSDAAGNKRDILRDIVAIEVPGTDWIGGSEQGSEGGCLRGGPGDDDCIVAFEAGEVVGGCGRRIERSCYGRGPGRPGYGVGKLRGGSQECRFQTGVAEALLGLRGIVVKLYIFKIECSGHGVLAFQIEFELVPVMGSAATRKSRAYVAENRLPQWMRQGLLSASGMQLNFGAETREVNRARSGRRPV